MDAIRVLQMIAPPSPSPAARRGLGIDIGIGTRNGNGNGIGIGPVGAAPSSASTSAGGGFGGNNNIGNYNNNHNNVAGGRVAGGAAEGSESPVSAPMWTVQAFCPPSEHSAKTVLFAVRTSAHAMMTLLDAIDGMYCCLKCCLISDE